MYRAIIFDFFDVIHTDPLAVSVLGIRGLLYRGLVTLRTYLQGTRYNFGAS